MIGSKTLGAVLGLGLTVIALPALARQSAYFELKNASETLIAHVQISAVTARSWGEDLLGNAMVPPTSSVVIGPKTEAGCRYDVRVLYQGGKEEVRADQDLCETRRLTFTGENARTVPNQPGTNQTGANQSGGGAPRQDDSAI
jgi:hypothetical protein